MITWNSFVFFALPAVLCWGIGAFFAFSDKGKEKVAMGLTIAGSLVFALFIAGFWYSLQRPPLRTMGETRLWYAFFMSLSGLFTYWRKRYRLILAFSTLLSSVFIGINLLKPEIHDQSLMPALQSFWFIPHVTVYMFSYSVLGCACLLAIAGLRKHKEEYLDTTDSLVYTGVAFLTVGMLTGAIWAKAAWGDYWSWDPKETWAAITWCGYVLYIHLRMYRRKSVRLLYGILIAAFLALQMCWYGVNYLPSAKTSIHIYNQ